MFYTTQYVTNLYTGEPFCLEVPDEEIRHLKLQQQRIQEGHAPWLGTLEELTTLRECSFFPSFQHVHKIWITNGYTEELMRQILGEFGVPGDFIQRLLTDEGFVSKVRPWFEGITCDGGRVARTLLIVYNVLKGYFSAHPSPDWIL